MPEIIDPEQQTTQPEGFDPDRDLISDMGYEGPPQETPEEPEAAKQPSELEQQATSKISDKITQQINNRLGVGKKAGEQIGKKGLQGVEKDVAQKASRKVATRSAQQAGKAAAGAGSRAAGTAAGQAAVGAGAAATGVGAGVAGAEVGATAGSVVPVAGNIVGAIVGFVVGAMVPWLWDKTKRYGKYILIAVTIFALVPALLFGLLLGKGLNQTPSTPAQQAQTTTVSAIGGDFIAKNKITVSLANNEKERYKKVQANVDNDPDPTVKARSSEVKKAITEITSLMDSSVNLTGEQKKQAVKDINSKVRALDSTLPYGKWLASEAAKYVGPNAKNTDFCAITGNRTPNLACASVVSVIMNSVGVPQPLTQSQFDIWRNSRLALVVDADPNHRPDPQLFTNNREKFRPGDIIWWGNGIRKGKVVGLQSHIGIFVGSIAGQSCSPWCVVNNSSSKSIAAGEAVPVASLLDRKDIKFNGAKRYGAVR